MRSPHLLLLAPLLIGGVQPGICATEPGATCALWQLPEQTRIQMMSYVIRTGKGKVIVIDGGTRGDAPYLRSFLNGLGGEVEAWFITHPHVDHCRALAEILAEPDGITIGRVYASLPSEAWTQEFEKGCVDDLVALTGAATKAGKCLIEMQPGELLTFDGLRVEVLAVKNPELHMNAINNSSAVLRVQDSAKSILFLGDLGAEGGEKLLKSRFANRLHADYVQMAHHGQSGVTREVYERIRPACCLWTTPKWLWENDNGGGKSSGPWKTLETRKWMEEMGVKRHVVTCVDGLAKIE